jgi:UDP-N-acetylmuramate dehydrogenase
MGLPEKLLSIPHRRDVPFSKLTTLGMGGACKWLFEPQTEAEAQLFIKTCRASDLDYRVLGGGSNLLVLSDISAPVMRLDFPKELRPLEKGIFANASYGHMALAHDAADMGYSGIEWACGIPGTFGGALRMNAGAHGFDWSHLLARARYLDPEGEIIERTTSPEDFSYRSSFLTEGHVALGASISLAKGDVKSIKKTMDDFKAARSQSQPRGRSAGCVFKNPPGKNAGQLIESAGMKGARAGNVEVSMTHANFLMNLGDGGPEDFLELIRLVRARVSEAHDCQLELEIEVWSEL